MRWLLPLVTFPRCAVSWTCALKVWWRSSPVKVCTRSQDVAVAPIVTAVFRTLLCSRRIHIARSREIHVSW